jgi:enolase
MKIISVAAREIFNSRGMPTLECTITLQDGTTVSASVPSGLSRGEHEAFELRDGGVRLFGLGMLKAVQTIETVIAPALIGHEPNVIRMDELMCELDGTDNKSKLGANTMLAVSIAVCRAQAASERIEPYELIAELCEYDMVSLPYPMFNVINGGLHANNGLHVQEFMVIPVGVSTFHTAMEIGATFFHILKKILQEQGFSTAVGDEGGFAPDIDDEMQVFDILTEAIDYLQHEHNVSLMIALDVAASHFYDKNQKMYKWHGDLLSSAELVAWYEKLVDRYPIYAIEDGLSEHDRDGWKKMMASLGSRIEVVGDDIFVTDPQRIYDGINEGIANTMLIKPNQIGTVTETLQAIKLCKEYEKNLIISHRSGETNDFFIADVAVGTSAGQIKAGGLSRGERLAKYNRLLQIEDQLLKEMEK